MRRRTLPLAVAGLMLLIVAPEVALSETASCWKAVGQQQRFGSIEQGEALKALTDKNPDCKLIAITWSVDFAKSGGHGIDSGILLWDEKAGSLIRLHAHELTGVRWEHWSAVTRGAIKNEDVSDDFDFQGYSTGKGKAPFSSSAIAFIRGHNAAGKFAGGL